MLGTGSICHAQTLTLLQQFGNFVIDVLRAVVAMKPIDLECKLINHQSQHRRQECLADLLDTHLNLPLANTVHTGDVIDPFGAVQSA